MRFAARAAALLLLWPALSACAAGAPTTPAAEPPRALLVAEAGSDVGNDRPQVSFDGPLVRHRIVLGVRLYHRVDLAAVRRHLARAGERSHTPVSPISASVLDPLSLEALEPDLVVALPPDATVKDGWRLMYRALRRGHGGDAVRAESVRSVLVHDLRFTIRTDHPAGLSRDIAREGILSDALGNYTNVVGKAKLEIRYTGPLLSDGLLRSVRAAIARRAHVATATVSVTPRTPGGAGVDLADVPIPAPDQSFPSTSHHDH